MRRLLMGTLALGALGAPLLEPAEGFLRWNGCGGNSFATCASVDLNTVGTQLTVRVPNYTGAAGTVFTDVALANLPTTITLAQTGVDVTGPPTGLRAERPRLSLSAVDFGPAVIELFDPSKKKDQPIIQQASPFH